MFWYSARATEMRLGCELLSCRAAVLPSTQLDGAGNLRPCMCHSVLPLIEIKARRIQLGL